MLPEKWKSEAFKQEEDNFILRQRYKDPVRFELLDIRKEAPVELFQVILCRNLAFTYFDNELQRTVLKNMEKKLAPGGILITGGHEDLPETGTDFSQWVEHIPIYQKGS